MSDLEALLWSLEGHEPALSSTITVVVAFDGAPDPDAVSERIEHLSRRVLRLRDRVVAGAVPTAPPRWEPDPEFDLGRHLVRAITDRALTLDELIRTAEPVAAVPLPRDRPLWQMVHVQSRAGRGALVVKLHHTLTDGLGAMKLAAELFDLERRPAGGGPLPPIPERSLPSVLGRLWEDLAFEAGHGVEVARRVIPWTTAAVRNAGADPERRAQLLIELLQSLRAMAETAARPASPVLVGRSAAARFGALAFPLADARRAARRAGGTVNDVFLAGLSGGLRLYHAKQGSFPASLRLGIPVSTRDEGTDADMRNQFAPVLLAAPLQLLDPLERIRALHDLVVSARHQPLLDLLEHATGILRRLPGALRVATALLRSTDVMASNVPGSPVDLYLGGAKVEHIVPFGPRGGSGLNLTLLSHVDTVNVGVNIDPATVTDVGVLMDCLRSGFDEVLI